MANLRLPKTKDEFKKLTMRKMVDEYESLAKNYNKILDGDLIYCHGENAFISSDHFYTDNHFASGYFPICKKCLLEMVEQRDSKGNSHETEFTVKRVLRLMDLPWYQDLYDSCVKASEDGVDRRNISSPFLRMLTQLKSLPNYRGKTWEDGDVNKDLNSVIPEIQVKEETKKRFGYGLSDDEYKLLQEEYEDWISKYTCNSKAQEELFVRLSFNKLERLEAIKNGKTTKDIKDIDKSYQELLSTLNIAPKQNAVDQLSQGKSLGQLIEAWETERPLPEIDEELRDVDHIGRYISVFFTGHLAKMLNLKNPLQNMYEKFMKKYTVTRPEYTGDESSEELFDKIFGHTEEDD